jgi:hypothetical protein
LEIFSKRSQNSLKIPRNSPKTPAKYRQPFFLWIKNWKTVPLLDFRTMICNWMLELVLNIVLTFISQVCYQNFGKIWVDSAAVGIKVSALKELLLEKNEYQLPILKPEKKARNWHQPSTIHIVYRNCFNFFSVWSEYYAESSWKIRNFLFHSMVSERTVESAICGEFYIFSTNRKLTRGHVSQFFF